MTSEHSPHPAASPLRIVLIYIVCGAFWITISDWLVAQLVPQALQMAAEIIKGWLYVALTALLLYPLIGRQLRELEQLTTKAQEDEALLLALGDNLPESYVYRYSYDDEGKPHFLYVSAGVETVHGVSREEVLRDGTVLNRQIPKEERQTLVASEELSRKTMSDFQMTISICRADGEKRWLLLCSRPHQNAAGQIIWDGVATDISRRYQVELALVEQRRFAENLIESCVPATFVLDAAHKVLVWNKACEELTGVTEESLVGSSDHWKAFYDHPHPCLADIALDSGYLGLAPNYENYAHSSLVKEGLHAEGWYRNLNGRDRYLFFDAAPVYDSSGKIIAAIETLLDHTELKESESSLRLQSTALQAAANAIVITNRLGIIEWVNPAFSELTGYRMDEALGKTPSELMKSGLHDQAFYKELWTTLLRGELWRGEMTNRHKDGTLYPEGQTITPVKDADGTITHFIAIKRDLREQRKLEEQLRQSQKMEALGTLAGGIAHDFNNILTAISGYGQLSLAKITADDPVRSNIESMLEAVDRAVRLTQQMLMFSRKQTSHKRTVELNSVINDVKKFLQRVIGEDITINSSLKAEPIFLQADDHQLEQVLMNLATNAGHAMPQGGTLTLTTETVELNHDFVSAYGYGTPGDYALITVTDTGSGMDQETVSRIFEPFFTTKEVGKGTGLGLAVAYGIIKNHSGYIDVASAPGEGTSFLIYLPLSNESQLTKPKAAPSAVNGGKETILLAEDDKMVREMTRELLCQYGYTVISAENGSDAVCQFTEKNAAIDLLLFDLIMPKMNGQEALEEIRKIRPDIKAIFSSGYAPETIQQKLHIAKNVHLISKPAAPNELLQMIRKVLDKSS